MKKRYRLFHRSTRGNTFYCVDTTTGKHISLETKNHDEAERILNAKNEAERQPILNLQIAKAYLAASDTGIITRTWQHAFDAIIETKRNNTKARWERAAKEKAFDFIRQRIIIETQDIS